MPSTLTAAPDVPRHIWLLDDAPGDRAHTAGELRAAFPGAAVHEIGDRRSFEEALAGSPPDAVVTESRLGWSSGEAVLEAVRARWPGCPVVMFTASGSEQLAVRMMRAAIEAAAAQRASGARDAEREALLAREREAREAAEAALRLKDHFLGAVAHELRGPLNAIVGWVQVLRSRLADDPTALRGLDVILRNVRGQARMVGELLDLSQALSGALTIHPQPLDPVAVVARAVDALRSEAEARPVALEVELAADAGMVPADPERLEQIAWHLVSNAIASTPAGGLVRVRLCGDADAVRLEVSATGVPERWQRPRGVGVDLGLAIVRHLVEAHRGQITAESAGPGRGATFRVTLPRQPPPAAAASPALPARVRAPGEPTSAPPPAPARARPLAGVAVVVVDTHAETRIVLQTALTHAGAEVRAAGDGDAAVAALEARGADLVVCDVAVPDGAAHALLDRLRAAPRGAGPPMAALALSSRTGPEARERAAAAGFDDCLTKPYEVARLVATARRLARARRETGR